MAKHVCRNLGQLIVCQNQWIQISQTFSFDTPFQSSALHLCIGNEKWKLIFSQGKVVINRKESKSSRFYQSKSKKEFNVYKSFRPIFILFKERETDTQAITNWTYLQNHLLWLHVFYSLGFPTFWDYQKWRVLVVVPTSIHFHRGSNASIS